MSNVPEKIYVNLDPLLITLVLTIPHLYVNLPENPSLEAKVGSIVVTLKNNGKYQLDQNSPMGFKARDLNALTEIESIDWQGMQYTGQELLSKRKELLNKFFTETLSGEENVKVLRQQNTDAGLGIGRYLYKAIDFWGLQSLREEKSKFFSTQDQNAVFEIEQRFASPDSKVKSAEHIIKWQIEEPLFYRSSGIEHPEITPFFPHFLPPLIELSNDGGKSFNTVQ